jgi:hypothetical protein
MNDFLRLFSIMFWLILFSLDFARGVRLLEKRNDFGFSNSSAVTLVPLVFGLTLQSIATLLILIFETDLGETMIMINSTFCYYMIYISLTIR